jgi:hypothetical protein
VDENLSKMQNFRFFFAEGLRSIISELSAAADPRDPAAECDEGLSLETARGVSVDFRWVVHEF